MKSAGNETITSAWRSRNLRREIQLTNKTHWGHKTDKKILKVVGLTKKSPWGHETDTTNIKHFSLTKKPLKTFSSKKKIDSLKPLIACKWQKRKLEDINLGTKTEILLTKQIGMGSETWIATRGQLRTHAKFFSSFMIFPDRLFLLYLLINLFMPKIQGALPSNFWSSNILNFSFNSTQYATECPFF